MPAVVGQERDGSSLHAAPHGRHPCGHLLVQHGTADSRGGLGHRRSGLPRGRARSSPAALPHTAADRAAGLPAPPQHHGFLGGLGPLRRGAGRGDGALFRPPRRSSALPPMRSCAAPGSWSTPGCMPRVGAAITALEYYTAHVPMPEAFLANEIDRYIVWPGQALAYLTGKRELLRLREEAERSLGDVFSLPQFHAAVLDLGSLPCRCCGRACASGWTAWRARRRASETKPPVETAGMGREPGRKSLTICGRLTNGRPDPGGVGSGAVGWVPAGKHSVNWSAWRVCHLGDRYRPFDRLGSARGGARWCRPWIRRRPKQARAPGQRERTRERASRSSTRKLRDSRLIHP